MKTSKVLPIVLVVVLANSGCSRLKEPSDERPSSPKTIATKYIDPEHVKCAKYKRGKCSKWKTDDEDYILVATDGREYDVDRQEYDSVNPGDRWPSNV